MSKEIKSKVTKTMKRVTGKSEIYNFVSLNGGKFYCNDPATFWKFIRKNRNIHGIVPKIPPHEHFKPFIIDVDMVLPHDNYMSTREFVVNYINPLETILSDIFPVGIEFTVLRRPQLVQSVYKKDKTKTVYKDGYHILFNNIQLTKAKGLFIKKLFMQNETVQNFIQKHKIIDAEELVDEHVIPLGANCTLVSPGKKKGRSDPYLPIYVTSEGDTEEFELSDPESKQFAADFLEDRLEWIYSYIFHREEWVTLGDKPKPLTFFEDEKENKPRTHTKVSCKKPSIQTTEHTNMSCNLPLILQHLPTTLSNSEWKQLVSFLVYIGYPKYEACTLLNAHFCPADLEENDRLYTQLDQKNGTPVKHASIMRLLRMYNDEVPNLNELFPVTELVENFNELSLTKGIYYLEEVKVKLRVFIRYIKENSSYVYSTRYTRTDKHGNRVPHVSQVITRTRPFSKEDKVRVKIYKTKSKLKEELSKTLKKSAILNDIETKTHQELLRLHQEHCQTPTCERKGTDWIVSEMMQDGDIERFNTIEFYPFLKRPPTHFKKDLIHNTFTGFPLQFYTPRKAVDFTKTNIYKYHNVVLGWQTIEDAATPTSLSEWIFKKTAFKLQYPAIRHECANIFSSTEQGTGKSSYTRWLRALVGAKYVKEHLSLDSYTNKDFNIQNSSKIFQTIEELYGAKDKTKEIYQLVTCDNREFCKKYENPVTLGEYHELYIMSNHKSASLHVVKDDRRIVIYDINPAYKDDREFWVQFNAELHDLDTMHSAFQYFANMDVENFNPKDLHPDLTKTKNDVKQDQQTKTHSFISELFQKHQWYDYGETLGSFHPVEGCDFLLDYNGKKNQHVFRICHDTFYKMYVHYIRAECHSKPRQMKTFLKECEEIGVKVNQKPKRFKKVMRKFCDISYSHIKKKWNTIYGADPAKFFTAEREYANKTATYFGNFHEE